MVYQWLGFGCNIVQIAALVVICARTYRRLDRREKYLPTILFLFGMVALMLSELYWLVHGLIRPDFRFPYSSSEISQDGGLLLLAAALVALLGRSRKKMLAVTVGAVCFTLINIALWILWSGEWFKDIFDGIFFTYYVVVVARSIKRTGGLYKREWKCLVLVGAALMAGETLWSFVPEQTQIMADVFNYSVIIAVFLFFLVKIIISLRRGDAPARSLCLAYGGFTWSLFSMYMSADPYYLVPFVGSTVMMVLMHVAMEREVVRA
ncbi:MAG: hypothetical protein IKX41_06030 [Oscillospiraceae bacterium]|nr:hypothetical protein [Oscillospiraceae bacterium]